jgi:hypothetical protein
MGRAVGIEVPADMYNFTQPEGNVDFPAIAANDDVDGVGVVLMHRSISSVSMADTISSAAM